MSMADKLNDLLEQRLEEQRVAKQVEESVIVTPATTKLPKHIYDAPSWETDWPEIDWSENASTRYCKEMYEESAPRDRKKVCYVADTEKRPIPRMLIRNRGDDYEFRLINSNWKYGVQSMIENDAIVLWDSRKQPPKGVKYLIVIPTTAKGHDDYWREQVIPHLDGMVNDKYSR